MGLITSLWTALRSVTAGTSKGLPLPHQLAIDMGHVVIGPVLVVYVGGWAALVWVLWFGVGKQIADYFGDAELGDALGDAMAMIVPTVWAMWIVNQAEWSDALALLDALRPVGWLMIAMLCAYGVIRVRRDR